MRPGRSPLEVERYVRGWDSPRFRISTPQEFQGVSTSGPAGLFQGVLIVEKDGLLEFVRRAGIGARYDLMVASSEVQGVDALEELVERFPWRSSRSTSSATTTSVASRLPPRSLGVTRSSGGGR
jgi:hypothetical protein